jgi:restriction system protein
VAVLEADDPQDWRDLQRRVARILGECGLAVEVARTIKTVRGAVEIDVLAQDSRRTPELLYLCECKHWKRRVPKTAVHALRTVVADSGANWGLLISSSGSQKGAVIAAEKSNVRLLDWHGFQELFVDFWLKEYAMPALEYRTSALIEYTDPVSKHVSPREARLATDLQRHVAKLRQLHKPLAEMFHFALGQFPVAGIRDLRLPLADYWNEFVIPDGLPRRVTSARDLRSLLDGYLVAVDTATTEFDKLLLEEPLSPLRARSAKRQGRGMEPQLPLPKPSGRPPPEE